MISMDFAVSVIVLLIVFVWYFYMVFELVDSYLDGAKLKKYMRIPLGALNVATSLILTFWQHSSSIVGYILIFCLFFIEFSLFYKDSYKKVYFLTMAFLIHFAGIRSVAVAAFSLANGVTLYETTNTTLTLIWSMILSLVLITFISLLYKRFMPAEKIRIILQHSEQRNYVSVILTIFNGYLLFDSLVFSINETYSMLTITHIILPLVLLIVSYVFIFFGFKTCELLGYKDKNIALEQSINSEKQLKQSLINEAVIFYEVNLTNDVMIKMPKELMDIIREKYPNDDTIVYSKAIKDLALLFIETNFLEDFLNYMDSERLIEELKQGRYETSIDYKRLNTEGKYVWVRASAYLFQDPNTDEIKGFIQVKDIDEEKQVQIALQQNAEKDLLTGVYNKATTERKITEYLLSKEFKETGGALYMIDVDNFKSINDEFGHLYGDEVLFETGKALKTVFRSDDIIGRIGGDEFMVFMKNNVRANAINKAARIDELVRQNNKYKVTYSIGVSVAPKDGAIFEELYKNADSALYESKKKGKNTYSLYDET